MAPSDFAKADIPSVVDQLTTEEAISLIAGVGFWSTHAIPRLGVPAIKVLLIIPGFPVYITHNFTQNLQVSDGPNGGMNSP